MFPGNTPRKKPRNVKSHPAASFRVSCGRERTQPLGRGDGLLIDRLDAGVQQAKGVINLVTKAIQKRKQSQGEVVSPGSAVRNALSKGLLLRFVERRHMYVLCLPLLAEQNDQTEMGEQIALVARDESIIQLGAESDTIADEQPVDMRPSRMRQYLLFVPYPWYAFSHSISPGAKEILLIVPHLIALIHIPDSIPLLCGLSLNSGLPSNNKPKNDHQEDRASCTHQLQHFLRSTSQEDAPVPTFAAISPHAFCSDIAVYVAYMNAERQFALVRDEKSQFAIVKKPSIALHNTKGENDRRLLRNYVINTHLPVRDVIDLISSEDEPRDKTELLSLLNCYRQQDLLPVLHPDQNFMPYDET